MTRPTIVAATALMIGAASAAYGGSLANRLDDVVTRNGLVRTDPSVAFVPRLEREAVRSADYPVTSTSPDFVYRFDPETGAPVRDDVTLDSIYLERAQTIGRHSLQIGASALYSKADMLDGNAVEGAISQVPVFVPGGGIGKVALRFDDFALETTGVLAFATYGVSDRLDLNVLVPVLSTRLAVDGVRTLFTDTAGRITLDTIDIDERKTGIGDVLLRSKYRLPDVGPAAFATTLAVRLPTGAVGDFQGLGDLTVLPGLVASSQFGAHELHANVAVDVNADALVRSRVRYGAGAAFRLHPRCSLLLDVLGSSGMADETIEAGRFTHLVSSGGATRFVIGRLPFVLPRSDVIDAAVGVKLKITESAVGFAGALVPITDDGLRAEVVPSAGVSFTF